MRKLDQAIIWPVYFDVNKTRKEGRRVPKNMAVSLPKILELQEAANRLGLGYEVDLEDHFPQQPWIKSGSIRVDKKEPKEVIIQKLAKQLIKIKNEN
ncbi:MAG: signal recognition particle protein Srp19 [Candidatus Bathyarchaeota archaeon]|nr:signal recognition particle protein Srp19 [Candidatus Bathyarchaeota archaeon]